MKKTLRATEIVKKLRSIEERYRTGQPSVLVFDVSETAKINGVNLLDGNQKKIPT